MKYHKAKFRDLSETAGQVTQQHKGPLCLRTCLLKRYHVYLPCNLTAVIVGWTLLPKQRHCLLPHCQTNLIIGLEMEGGVNHYQFA